LEAIPKGASGTRRLASGVYLRRSVLEGFAAFTETDRFDLVDPFNRFELLDSERLSDGGSDV
jgi:hypothetical protein